MKTWLRYVLCMGGAALLAGCGSTNSYAPPPGVSGAQMWQEACARCHKSIDTFKLAQRKADASFIANMISSGNASMPAFPHIRDEALETLTRYIIENSARR